MLAKELRAEGRAPVAIGATLLFSVGALAAMAYTIGENRLGPAVHSALVWIVLLFAAFSGLARPFVREEEMRTADYLRLHAPPSAVLTGKLLFNVLQMLAIEIVTVPLYFLVIPASLAAPDIGLLIASLALGGIGLASAATLIAAMIARSSAGGSGGGALFFVVALPIVLPLLMGASRATFAAIAPILAPPSTAWNSVTALVSYDVVVVAASYLLFGFVWADR